MSTSTLEQQLAPVVEGRVHLANVRTAHGNFIVLSERLGERFRPLLEYMARHVSTESVPSIDNGWTDKKNTRRGALIEKKYAGGLTAVEKRELKALQQEVGQFADRVAGPRNEILELLLLGLEHKAARQKATG